MTAVNVLRDQIADHAADQHVGRKMLVRFHARNIHQGSQAVSKDFREWTGILMRDNTGNGPRCRSMLRRKGSAAALKERATAIALIRPLTLQRIFQSFDHHETIDRRFARKKTRLTPMIVVRCATQQPHSSPTADERADASIRKRLVVTDRCGT